MFPLALLDHIGEKLQVVQKLRKAFYLFILNLGELLYELLSRGLCENCSCWMSIDFYYVGSH